VTKQSAVEVRHDAIKVNPENECFCGSEKSSALTAKLSGRSRSAEQFGQLKLSVVIALHFVSPHEYCSWLVPDW
jgi:hypothetical protein